MAFYVPQHNKKRYCQKRLISMLFIINWNEHFLELRSLSHISKEESNLINRLSVGMYIVLGYSTIYSYL